MTNFQQKALALGLMVVGEVVTYLLKPKVTDDMVERAVDAFFIDPPGEVTSFEDAMRAALEAALQGKNDG